MFKSNDLTEGDFRKAILPCSPFIMVDECCSPDFADHMRQNGYGDNIKHVNDFGLQGTKDPDLFDFLREFGFSAIITLDKHCSRIDDLSLLAMMRALEQHGNRDEQKKAPVIVRIIPSQRKCSTKKRPMKPNPIFQIFSDRKDDIIAAIREKEGPILNIDVTRQEISLETTFDNLPYYFGQYVPDHIICELENPGIVVKPDADYMPLPPVVAMTHRLLKQLERSRHRRNMHGDHSSAFELAFETAMNLFQRKENEYQPLEFEAG